MTTASIIIGSLCAGYALCIIQAAWIAYRDAKRPITNPFLRRVK